MLGMGRWDLQIFSLETFFLQPAASPVGHQGRFAELVRRRRRLLLRVQRLLLRRGSKITERCLSSVVAPEKQELSPRQSYTTFRSSSNLPSAAAPQRNVPRPNPSSSLRFEPEMLHLMNASPTSRSTVSSNEASINGNILNATNTMGRDSPHHVDHDLLTPTPAIIGPVPAPIPRVVHAPPAPPQRRAFPSGHPRHPRSTRRAHRVDLEPPLYAVGVKRVVTRQHDELVAGLAIVGAHEAHLDVLERLSSRGGGVVVRRLFDSRVVRPPNGARPRSPLHRASPTKHRGSVAIGPPGHRSGLAVVVLIGGVDVGEFAHAPGAGRYASVAVRVRARVRACSCLSRRSCVVVGSERGGSRGAGAGARSLHRERAPLVDVVVGERRGVRGARVERRERAAAMRPRRSVPGGGRHGLHGVAVADVAVGVFRIVVFVVFVALSLRRLARSLPRVRRGLSTSS